MKKELKLRNHDSWYDCPGCGETYEARSCVTCPKCKLRAFTTVLEQPKESGKTGN